MWVISGANLPGHGNVPANSGWNNNYTTTNPLTVNCAAGYTYYFQAIFKAGPNPPADTMPIGMSAAEATVAIVFLAAVAIAEAVALGLLYAKTNKK